jgi:RNA polymerase sigma factor (sigma-70 family)
MMQIDAPSNQEKRHVRTFQAYLNADANSRATAEEACLAALREAGISLWEFLSGLDDLTLVRAIRRDCFSSAAFQVLLVTRREKRLTQYFIRHGLNWDDALDLVQTLYLKLVQRGLDQFAAPGDSPPAGAGSWQKAERVFDRWLFGGVARNLLLDWFRHRPYTRRRQHDTLGAAWQPASPDPTPIEDAIENEEAERVRGAIANLPEREREIFCGYYDAGLTLSELARKYGLNSITSAWRLLDQARQAVSAAVEGRDPRQTDTTTPPR